jgi:hypothetical protein
MGQVAGETEFIPLPQRKPARAEAATDRTPYL